MKEQCRLPDVLWYVLRLDDKRVTEADANVLNLIRKKLWRRDMGSHDDCVHAFRHAQNNRRVPRIFS